MYEIARAPWDETRSQIRSNGGGLRQDPMEMRKIKKIEIYIFFEFFSCFTLEMTILEYFLKNIVKELYQ